LKSIDLSLFRPRMKVLDRHQAWAIHEAALEMVMNSTVPVARLQLPVTVVWPGSSVSNRGRSCLLPHRADPQCAADPRKLIIMKEP